MTAGYKEIARVGWRQRRGGKIICVVLYNARCCAVAARCHILVIPSEKPR